MKYIFAILIVFTFQKISSQNIIGIKSVRILTSDFNVANTKSSPLNLDSKGLYLNINPYFESYFNTQDYAIVMVEYEKNKSVNDRLRNYGNGLTGYESYSNESSLLRFDMGLGKKVELEKSLTLKVNTTLFYQFTIEQSQIDEIILRDSTDKFVSRYWEIETDPPIKNLGISFTPQFNYNVWKGINFHIDLRLDFYYHFFKGFKYRKEIIYDEFNNPSSQEEDTTYLKEDRLTRDINYGFGVSYQF